MDFKFLTNLIIVSIGIAIVRYLVISVMLALREKVNQLWDIISAVDEFFSLGKPTAEENEAGAIMCEQWCKVFPVLFP